MDFYTGLVTAVVGAAATWNARDLSMFGAHNVPGPGFFPKILAGLLIVLGLLLAAIAVREGSEEHEADRAEPGAARRMLRPVGVLIVFGVIAPLVAIIGYIPAMVLLVLVILYGIERRRDFRSLLAAVLIPVATYVLFAHLFAIPLPSGPLFPA
ncbi:MAG: tripartite tricarboxylate transporter TctB family protein [Mycobacterium sp.]